MVGLRSQSKLAAEPVLSDPPPRALCASRTEKEEGEGAGFVTWNALSAASQGHVGSSCIFASFGVRPIVCRQKSELCFHFHSGQPFMGVA